MLYMTKTHTFFWRNKLNDANTFKVKSMQKHGNTVWGGGLQRSCTVVFIPYRKRKKSTHTLLTPCMHYNIPLREALPLLGLLVLVTCKNKGDWHCISNFRLKIVLELTASVCGGLCSSLPWCIPKSGHEHIWGSPLHQRKQNIIWAWELIILDENLGK